MPKIKGAEVLARTATLVRVYSRTGGYPDASIRLPSAAFEVSEELIWSATRFRPDILAERLWLVPEEVRLLSAITLSLPPDAGKFVLYPVGEVLRLAGVGVLLSPKVLASLQMMVAERVRELDARGDLGDVHGSSLVEGGSYATRAIPSRDWVPKAYERIRLQNRVLIRGLDALLKANCLAEHPNFHVDACSSLYVAMEATFQIVRRRLRRMGRKDSAEGAMAYIEDSFGLPKSGLKYFEDYYEDRIIAVHPSNRFGDFSYAPLMADDFYLLRHSLIDVFRFLVTGDVPID